MYLSRSIVYVERMVRLLFLIICLLSTSCFADLLRENLTAFDYHVKIGVPQADAIWAAETRGSRIIGGCSTGLGAIPFQAGLVITLTTGWLSICGGVLISNTRVLTAAHCWWDGRNHGREMTVVLGSNLLFSGGTRVMTNSVYTHMDWNPNYLTHDISMVTISRVAFTNEIDVVALPSLADIFQEWDGWRAKASGFGKTSDAQSSFPTTTSLFDIDVDIITNRVCQMSFSVDIHHSHICINGDSGVSTCDGDAGGPLTVSLRSQRTLVGIASFGFARGCERGFPSVFTRVTSFLTWIQANM